MKSLARSLRSNMTDAERRLWYHLRVNRFEGFKFRRQESLGPYVVDFVCVEARLIIEADGGQHSKQRNADEQRTEYLQSLGYRVLRFWNHDILNDTERILEHIRRHLL